MDFEDFVKDSKVNAYLFWILTAVVGLVFLESLYNFDRMWMLMSATLLIILSMPALIHKDLHATIPWELTLIAVIHVIVRTLELSIFANQISTYISIAAIALIIAVQLNLYTSVKFNHSFAIVFTVVATLAIGGVWSIVRYNMDLHLETSFLTDNDALMHEYLNILVAGVFAGVLFDQYFRRRVRTFRDSIDHEVKAL